MFAYHRHFPRLHKGSADVPGQLLRRIPPIKAPAEGGSSAAREERPALEYERYCNEGVSHAPEETNPNPPFLRHHADKDRDIEKPSSRQQE
jgi:hypothetical protein